MNSFWPLSGSVYVLENVVAQRVKVGMTGIGLNDVVDRLRDVNDMWAQRKVTCQICGGRLLNIRELVPRHVKSGRACDGGDKLPIEKSTELAARRLQELRDSLKELRGIGLGSAVRMASTLERRIEKYRDYTKPTGDWQFGVSFYTARVVEVESLAHKMLADRLDRQAPFGEVFCCTASEATEVVEAALSQLGLRDSAKRRAQLQDFRGWYQLSHPHGDA